MGSGKTTVGRALAAEWGCDFIDLDRFIEQETGQKIPDIFNHYGETRFRNMETDALRKVLESTKPMVISLGGGTPCMDENMLLIKEKSLSVYLKVSPEELVRRLLRSENPRPLIAGKTESDLKDYIHHLLKQREPFYLNADQVIESDCLQVKDLLTFIGLSQ